MGSKWKLFIPADLAYGPTGRPGIPSQISTLIFQVELLSIDAPARLPVTPAAAPLTSDIIKVPSAEEMKKGAKIEVHQVGRRPENAAADEPVTSERAIDRPTEFEHSGGGSCQFRVAYEIESNFYRIFVGGFWR